MLSLPSAILSASSIYRFSKDSCSEEKLIPVGGMGENKTSSFGYWNGKAYNNGKMIYFNKSNNGAYSGINWQGSRIHINSIIKVETVLKITEKTRKNLKKEVAKEDLESTPVKEEVAKEDLESTPVKEENKKPTRWELLEV